MKEHMHLQARQRVADVFQGLMIYNSVIWYSDLTAPSDYNNVQTK